MSFPRVAAYGIPVFGILLAACTSAAPDTQPADSVAAPTAVPDSQSEIAEPDPATIQLGALSLTWEEHEVGDGIKPAFAIDAEGVAHAAFLTEADHGGLFYAHNRSGDFVVETVAEGYFYGPIDLALTPSGEPLIAYHDHQALQFDPELGDEVVARLIDGAWQLSVVSDDGHDGWDNSIVVDSDGNWHTAAVDPSQFGSNDGVEYATNSDAAVSVTAVGSGPIRYEFGTSVQLDPSGAPFVAYYNDRDDQLEISSLTADGWVVKVVDAAGDAGRYPSLAFDSEGHPHIAYYVATDRNAGTVRHAWKDTAGWQTENVGDLDNVQMGQVGARKITSLAFDPSGNLHLAYTDRDQLVYARRTDVGWIGQEVIESGSRTLGQLVELAIGPDGNPHLIWYEAVRTSPSLEGIVRYAAGSE